ncbi:MAG: 23S rRNA (guanosine(2251)-2'-O)-methyltransferase RlmB [Alphaproteobacteria bacterium]|jgi:23S rRNA (guanosine2251-2'-O)-methyltransferase|nr:23S rRNA (guanosine(2251)-2'-O)-methyltransferase RlmB [Alphaproteobacteria bacterium]
MRPQKSPSHIWLYGIHVCRMVLENQKRQIISIQVINEDILGKVLTSEAARRDTRSKVKQVDRRQLETLLPAGAVHQGIAVQVTPLPAMMIDELENDPSPNQCVVVLDQVSDPHNVGAILRSAAVFGAKALILTDRNAPTESGVLAKSGSGALEIVPIIRVTNLAHALKDLKDIGFWCVGFAETGDKTLDQIDLKGKIALVMGAEGDGMRRLTKDLCDFTVSLPTASSFSALNVSNAAAIALYETFRIQKEA